MGFDFSARRADIFFALITIAMAVLELTGDWERPLETTLWFCLHAVTAVLFLIRNRRTDHPGGRWYPALITAASLCFPYLFDYGTGMALVPGWVGGVLMMIGGALAVSSILSLGGSFGVFPAIREVRLGGMYRLVRHPMYASYLLMDFALLSAAFTMKNLLVLGIAIALYMMRIREEEKLLVRIPAYVDYAKVVRRRLIPGLY